KQLLEKQKSDPKARLAITMFVNSVVKIIGSYIALSPSIPGAIIFSGGIGERSAYLRNQIKKHFRFLPSLRFV
ncbi:TPA: hypothetical protein DEP21_05810, partial [Patescibacteria group bacterium]|nr:hypothetical protein [Candidatus Gracilibacteria bacterium]